MEPGQLKSSIADPFETIESAHSFVALLAEAVSQAKHELEMDVQRESNSSESRRLDALRIALYSVDKLEAHMNRSGRILNDLRSLRRLLFQERANAAVSAIRSGKAESPVAETVNPTGARTHRDEKPLAA